MSYISKQLVLVIVFLLVFVLQPTQAQAVGDFSAQYFNNPDLSGSPVSTRTETNINHDWVAGSPDASVPVDNFSARWTGTFTFEAGDYTFSTTSDDGVRLIVDGQAVINQWITQGPTTIQTNVNLTAGNHEVKLEYFEGTGGALVELYWEKKAVENPSALRVMPLGDSLTDGYSLPGGYRVSLKNLVSDINLVGSLQNGPAQLTDRDHEGHTGWRIDQIQAGVVPWLQGNNPQMILMMIGSNDINGNYNVSTAPQRLSDLIDTITQTQPNADLLVASIIPINANGAQPRADAYNAAIPGIIQQKKDQGKKVHYVDLSSVVTYADLPDGIHPNEAGYTKIAQKWADAIQTVRNGSTPSTPEPTPTPDPGTGLFAAKYYNNLTLSGTPVLSRNEAAVNYDWVGSSPHASVNNDNFSASWTTTQAFEAGTYEFKTTTDDGVTLEVDGTTMIDKWLDQGPTAYTANKELTAGVHTVVMKYYEKGGGATAKLSWLNTAAPEPEVPAGDVPTDNGFKAEYFNNMTLTGTPALTRSETAINNDWGNSSPHASIGNDFFTTKWQGNFTFNPGTYRFTVRADDGIRLMVGDTVVIDQWIDQGPTTYTADLAVSGLKKVQVEYYEKSGGAVAQASWAVVTPSEPAPENPPVTGEYQAEYFNNINLTGTPVLTRSEAAINNDWGTTSPHASVNNDNFSARWTKTQDFAAGTYRFTMTADDGMRLKVDGQLVINQWLDQAPTTRSVELPLSAGNHTIVMEYYEKGYGAVAKLTVESVSTTPVTTGSFNLSYFNNMTLTGAAIYTAVESLINFDWGTTSPHASVPVDGFSARAVKTADYSAGTYRFTLTGDDGVRLKVDGTTVIDQWVDQGPTAYTKDIALTSGNHTITVEYYEKGGGAVLKLGEVKL